jgi:uncharacterized protein (TIGR02246 family)
MMRPITSAVFGLFVVVVAAQAQVGVGTGTDEAAIRAVLQARNAAYNRHDAAAMTSVHALDADLVTGTGRYLSGRAALERYYADQVNEADKNAIVKIDALKLRFLTPDVALLDMDGTVTGRLDGIAKNHATWTYVKRNSKWEVVAIRASRVQ